MRYRICRGGPARRFAFDRPAAAQTVSPSLRPAALDNPYGRYYTRPRTREDLLRNKNTAK